MRTNTIYILHFFLITFIEYVFILSKGICKNEELIFIMSWHIPNLPTCMKLPPGLVIRETDIFFCGLHSYQKERIESSLSISNLCSDYDMSCFEKNDDEDIANDYEY